MYPLESVTNVVPALSSFVNPMSLNVKLSVTLSTDPLSSHAITYPCVLSFILNSISGNGSLLGLPIFLIVKFPTLGGFSNSTFIVFSEFGTSISFVILESYL